MGIETSGYGVSLRKPFVFGGFWGVLMGQIFGITLKRGKLITIAVILYSIVFIS